MSEEPRRINAIELRGRATAAKIDADVKLMLDAFRSESETQSGRQADWDPPALAVFRVGNQPDDIRYEKGILKTFGNLGLGVRVFEFPAKVSQKTFLVDLMKANEDPGINGILVFQPLPKHIDGRLIAGMIDPRKDVDGISPANVAKVFSADMTGFAPCTAVSVMTMLDRADIDLAGMKTVVVGRSMVIGKPLSMLLLSRDATVTVCHSKTKNLPAVCKEAEILIACIGRPKMITADYVRPGAVVIDVGINVDDDGALCGDVDFEAVGRVAGAITPSPGGVGVVTTSVLAMQVMKAAKLQTDS